MKLFETMRTERRWQAAGVCLGAALVLAYALSEVWFVSQPAKASLKRSRPRLEAPALAAASERPASSLTRPLDRLGYAPGGYSRPRPPLLRDSAVRGAPRPFSREFERPGEVLSGPDLGPRAPVGSKRGLLGSLGRALSGAGRRLAGGLSLGGGSAATGASLSLDRRGERGERAAVSPVEPRAQLSRKKSPVTAAGSVATPSSPAASQAGRASTVVGTPVAAPSQPASAPGALQAASAGPAALGLAAVPAAQPGAAADESGNVAGLNKVDDVDEVKPIDPRRNLNGMGLGDCAELDLLDRLDGARNVPGGTPSGRRVAAATGLLQRCAAAGSSLNAACAARSCAQSESARIVQAVVPLHEGSARVLASALDSAKSSLEVRISSDKGRMAELYAFQRQVIGNDQLHECVYGAANSITNRVVWLEGYRAALQEAVTGLRQPRPSAQAPGAWKEAALRAAEHREAIVYDLGELLKRARTFEATCMSAIPDSLADRRHGTIPYWQGREAKRAFTALVRAFIPEQEALLRAYERGWCEGGACAAPDASSARRLIREHSALLDSASELVGPNAGAGVREAGAHLEAAAPLLAAPGEAGGRSAIEGVFLVAKAAAAAERGVTEAGETRELACSEAGPVARNGSAVDDWLQLRREQCRRARASATAEEGVLANLARRFGLGSMGSLLDLLR